MVKVKLVSREKAIVTTKRRIKSMEIHGQGIPAMQEKAILQKQEHSLKLFKEKLNA